MNVIIAEDEKWVRATIIRTIPFEELGLTLLCEASNGIEAYELCKEHRPDILITDLMMPGLSGLELIEKLYKTNPEIKIVIISGHSDFEYAKTALKFGVCEYLLKPLDKLEISRVLSKVKANIIESKKKIEESNFYKTNYIEMLPLVQDKILENSKKERPLTTIETACKIIQENFYTELSLENVARHVFLSPTYFSELFKKETGMSFIDYKTHLRIENAKKLICSTNLNINEIGIKVGYSDPKYFSKLFKKITGSSPNKFKGINR